MHMAISLESLRDFNPPIDFRAPPPSPVASGRRSSVANDDVLSEFLEHSLRVPDLVLPDRVFPRQKPIQNPSKLDCRFLDSPENESLVAILDSIGQIGCFQLVNHGVPRDIIQSVITSGAPIFQMSPEKKAAMSRSSERPNGFVESHGDEERESSEEFVWCKEESLKLEMEGILPIHYSNFSDKMEKLLTEIEKIAEKFIPVLEQKFQKKWSYDDERGRAKEQELVGTICYLYKHGRKLGIDQNQVGSSLKYDVIRMLIRGSERSHAVCLHICDGSSEFHVYSKKGWVSFCPDKDSLVVTIGDQLQILEMESLYRDKGEESLSEKFCQELATRFSFSSHRSGTSTINCEQVQSWFQDKHKRLTTKVTLPPASFEKFMLSTNNNVTESSSPATLRQLSLSDAALTHDTIKIPQKSKGERIAELSELIFEALSAKDCAWYDVASFLNYRILHTGELEVRVRFSGFRHDEDEWVNVRRAVRERSIPLEPSECHRIKVGDCVLCFKENDDHALYTDARILEIQRNSHDTECCSCTFLVSFDYDNSQASVDLTKLCCRPT